MNRGGWVSQGMLDVCAVISYLKVFFFLRDLGNKVSQLLNTQFQFDKACHIDSIVKHCRDS